MPVPRVMGCAAAAAAAAACCCLLLLAAACCCATCPTPFSQGWRDPLRRYHWILWGRGAGHRGEPLRAACDLVLSPIQSSAVAPARRPDLELCCLHPTRPCCRVGARSRAATSSGMGQAGSAFLSAQNQSSGTTSPQSTTPPLVRGWAHSSAVPAVGQGWAERLHCCACSQPSSLLPYLPRQVVGQGQP